MSVQEIRVVLSAADPTRKHPDPDEVARTLAVDVAPYQVYGHGSTGNAVGIRIFSLSSDDFLVESEPGRRRIDWTGFEDAVTNELVTFAQWLSRISVEAVDTLRSRGLDVYVLVNLEIESDQMDFDLPHQLSTELGRLRLRLWMLSNE
jgi:hypothetical protein